MSEEEMKPEEDPRTKLGVGVDPEGFFTVRIHVSRGLREVLGFLEQAKDVAKSFYVEQYKKEQEAKKLVQPSSNGFLKSFKNKWH